MVIKQVGALSVAKIGGVLYAGIGLIIGAVVSLVAMAGAAFAPDSGMPGWFGPIAGVGAIVLMPIFYGALGFVATLIGAWLFNVATRITGGVQIDVLEEHAAGR